MTPIVFVTSGVMLIVALMLVLWPLQRGAAKSISRVREAGGKLRALNEARTAGSVGTEQSAALQAAIAKLAGKLRQHPEDAEGWALLGRAYKAMQQ